MQRFWAPRAYFAILPALSPATRLVRLGGCALLLFAAHASAGQVHLAWDAVSSPSLAGYRLYYGQTSGTYPTYIDVGLQTTATVTGLTAGQTYYFVVTAYDTAGDESGPSNTVTVTMSPDVPHPAGDLDGDGKADVVWRNTTTSDVAVWLMNGLTPKQEGVIWTAPLAWQIVGVGDFNGDGTADILWWHTSGTLYLWLMNGLSIVGQGSPGGASTDWTVVSVGDFNGDGTADILWRHTSGTLYLWLLNGPSVIGEGSPGGATTDWQSP